MESPRRLRLFTSRASQDATLPFVQYFRVPAVEHSPLPTHPLYHRFSPSALVMSRTFFDRSQNLQIQGDLTLVSSGGSTHDDPGFFHVSQRVQASNAQSRAIERGFKLLCDNTAPSARYGSGESFTGPQCHPGTRIAVQDYIFKWLDDPDGQIAMWMNGPVGIGKSAIAQTVAHLAAERGQLSSAFFFFRSDDSRNTVKYLVPTLAYEMTQRMPHTLDRVCQTIAANPHLFSSPLDYQISSTLLRPLCIPCESSLRGRMLIVIDGVDESLDTKAQQAIIRSFILGFLRVAEETIPHKILIVSRPESHIASAVLAVDINPHVRSLALESWNTEDDIELFLRAKFKDIQQTHPLRHHLPSVWPSNASFRRLRERSVGSFAYASVAIRFLASHNNNPERALQDLLLLRPNRAAVAFADLDALYRHILLSLDAETRFILQKVLCLFVYCRNETIQSLAARVSEDESIVELALLRVSSILQIQEFASRQYIAFHHTSFEEFLRDKERSGDLYVFAPNVARAVAHGLSSLWLHPISDLDEYRLFRDMSELMSAYNMPNTEMYLHVIKTLVATRIPASFLHPFSGIWESNRVDFQFTCNNAYNVICNWLRSHFNLFFQDAPTPNDVLDILLEDWQKEGNCSIASCAYFQTSIAQRYFPAFWRDTSRYLPTHAW
ncbi:hypothetical protein D9619_005146 [Psilocybe cf. subviscida]|uniref:Nephrocystin 3-like N-terminal domain-containing protein n=1 Tax=Psilocybe cf. subviscida TaxID=2480587 RepID=A0A8H5BRI3_9AGAR|nr:hypothetical protein D9619_005146 [Psilocybe cf. subviscida]